MTHLTSNGKKTAASEDYQKAMDLIGSEPLATDTEGRMLSKVALFGTLYFHNGYRQDVRETIFECIEEYLKLYHSHLRWVLLGAGHFAPLRKYQAEDIKAYLLSERFEESNSFLTWNFTLHGGGAAGETSDYLLEALGNSRRDCELGHGLSYVKLAFPLSTLGDQRELLPQFMGRWCTRLHPYHGYGGIGILITPELSKLPLIERAVYACAQRYPGIEVDYPLNHSLWTQDSIKGGNWITVLANSWLDKLGGVNLIRQKLGPQFQVAEYDGGAIILAGPLPEIGDRNRGLDTPNYRILADLLKSIRVKIHPAIHGPSGGFDRAGFEAWLERFDE